MRNTSNTRSPFSQAFDDSAFAGIDMDTPDTSSNDRESKQLGDNGAIDNRISALLGG